MVGAPYGPQLKSLWKSIATYAHWWRLASAGHPQDVSEGAGGVHEVLQSDARV